MTEPSLLARLEAAAKEGLEPNLRRFLAFRGWTPGEVVELQVLDVPRCRNPWREGSMVAHIDAFPGLVARIEEASGWRGDDNNYAAAISMILNQPAPEVAGRSGEPHRWRRMTDGTSDGEILSRRALYIDLDADRPKGISARAAHVARTFERAALLAAILLRHVSPDSLGYGHSGNGAGLFVALDVPCDSESDRLVRAALVACKHLASDVQVFDKDRPRDESRMLVAIDPSVSDRKRLCPAFGSMKRKGANKDDRAHRRTAFLGPASPVRLDLAGLRALVDGLRGELQSDEARAEVDRALVDPRAKAAPRPSNGGGAAWGASSSSNDDAFRLANEGIPVADVLARLGLLDGDRPVCPGCNRSSKAGGMVEVIGNGLKCSSGTCGMKGHPSRPGFRSVVDVVAEARNLNPGEALAWLRAEFPGVIPERQTRESYDQRRAYQPPPGRAAGVPPEAEAPPPSAPRPWPTLADLVSRFEAAPAKLPVCVDPIDTGWRGGAPSGLLWVIGGAPGAGKTTFATWLAHRWAKRGVPVAFIAGDEPRDGILVRLGQQSGIDRTPIEEGQPEALGKLAAYIGDLPLRLLDPDDDDGVTVGAVAEWLREQHPEGPAVLVVDSLQAMARRIPDELAESPRAKVDAFLKGCKAAAKRHGILILCLSELARGAYRGGPEQTADLAATKESGAIEYECGALCILRPVEDEPGLVNVTWPKSRPGRVEPFALRQCHARATFTVESVTQREKGKPPAAAHTELMGLIVGLLKRDPGLAGPDAVRARLGRRRDEVREAVKELLATGVIENRGTPARPRLYWLGHTPPEGDSDPNPPNQPKPAPNQPGAGSGEGKPAAVKGQPTPRGVALAGRVSPGAPGGFESEHNRGAGLVSLVESDSADPLEAPRTPPAPPVAPPLAPPDRNAAGRPAPGLGRVPFEAIPNPATDTPSTPPPPSAAQPTSPAANEAATTAQLTAAAAGAEDEWEALE